MVLKLLMGFNQVTQVLTECRITEIIRHGFEEGPG